jgi:hypothetical protein
MLMSMQGYNPTSAYKTPAIVTETLNRPLTALRFAQCHQGDQRLGDSIAQPGGRGTASPLLAVQHYFSAGTSTCFILAPIALATATVSSSWVVPDRAIVMTRPRALSFLNRTAFIVVFGEDIW